MLIATIPPMARHRSEIAEHPGVDALRLNTGMPIFGSIKEKLSELKELSGKKPLYIDLKARQLRITKWGLPTYACIELNYSVKVRLNAQVYLRGVREPSYIVGVEGNKIIIDSPPDGAVGDGQAINIADQSLEVIGFWAEKDPGFIEAAKSLGLHRYLLSFVESAGDLAALRELDPEAEIIAKIESEKGLAFASNEYPRLDPGVRLMLARDDLFLSLQRNKLRMLEAEQDLVKIDSGAIAASRLFSSLEYSDRVSLADFHEIESLRSYGYRHFMLSDDLCSDPLKFRVAVRAYQEIIGDPKLYFRKID